MTKLTKDDLYEIEKICDVYAGWINERMNEYCKTAIKVEGVNALQDKSVENPLDKVILELDRARKKVKAIRDKLESMRYNQK